MKTFEKVVGYQQGGVHEVCSREVYVNIPNHSFELSRVLPLSISMY